MLGAAAVAGILVAAALAASCGVTNTSERRSASDVTATVASTELVVGTNRFVLSLLYGEGQPLMTANVHLRFYSEDAPDAPVRSEMNAIPRLPACDVDQATEDETLAGHGVYTATVAFDRPGTWRVDIGIVATVPAVRKTLQAQFEVLPQGQTPEVGSPAPRTRNLTVADVPRLGLVDSSPDPSAEMHTAVIADVIAEKRPLLVLFGSPADCRGALCALELDVMRKLLPRYWWRVEFIHVEYYEEAALGLRRMTAAAKEWNLPSQPWFFVIDSEGIIQAKFEGATSLSELDQALRRVAP